ncbi:beta-L-arabinofuranosidase domain-containing protein [Thermoanaerobacter sp. CM-CNRG TB177]|jgi:hypothetical protein|uniref:beta-L-arabinofuranosidase domain-containing protein n=1 Tax=Thermoanaerobacter TaxID=1754 RepID=UPI001BDE0277|nr:beta-L-arabinofuranosidase domain-containing protein [Thermoanaerobacter sp. CM-CNRG TB177]MBT1280359.1 glycosyltransferase [Thermoanaerobacter sp. CM-CNRG TB177]
MKVSTKFQHLFNLTDDTGILQHSLYSIPDLTKGYTTDDNTRALIAASMLYEVYKDEKYLELLRRYLSFLIYAQNSKGYFRNFMNYNREFIEEVGSEDCFGRCLWSLGYLLNTNLSNGFKNVALALLKKALPNVANLNFLRGNAYSLIGLSLLYNSDVTEFNKEKIKNLMISISKKIVQRYRQNKDGEWKWFENVMTYSNAVIPWSLLKVYTVTKDEEVLEVAKESMEFLAKVTFKNDYFKPVGCKGWYKKGNEKPAEFDEQPIEACETALMYTEAYKIFKEEKYREKAFKCYKWFLGENSKNVSLVDEETGGCYDGLTKDGVNLNEGAESVISLIITEMIVNHTDIVFK